MTLTVQLANKDFEDCLAVSVNGETKDLAEGKIQFDIPDVKEIDVRVELLNNDVQGIKNPIGRFFSYLLIFLLSVINFFCDNDNGIGIHKFFYGANPFNLKKTFKIVPTENIVLKFVSAKYERPARCFSFPDIELIGAQTIDESLLLEYDREAFKKEFRWYHYPAYTVLFAIVIALNALMAICLFNCLYMPFHLAGVIGMSFCCVAMLVLLIAFICFFASTHRLLRQVDANLNGSFALKGDRHSDSIG